MISVEGLKPPKGLNLVHTSRYGDPITWPDLPKPFYLSQYEAISLVLPDSAEARSIDSAKLTITWSGAGPTECDRLGAERDDPDSPLYWEKRTEQACLEEVAKHPSEVRFRYQLGRAHESLKQYPQARAAFEIAANLGYSQAMYKLYPYYVDGKGGQSDPQGALRWLEKSAKLGSPNAMTRLANLFAGRDNDRGFRVRNYRDLGVKVDPVRTKYWYERAIATRHAHAARSLSSHYTRGGLFGNSPKKAASLVLDFIKLGGSYSTKRSGFACDDIMYDDYYDYSDDCEGWYLPSLDKSVRWEIQEILIREGYLIGRADGIIGDTTAKALSDWRTTAATSGSTTVVSPTLPTNAPATR